MQGPCWYLSLPLEKKESFWTRKRLLRGWSVGHGRGGHSRIEFGPGTPPRIPLVLIPGPRCGCYKSISGYRRPAPLLAMSLSMAHARVWAGSHAAQWDVGCDPAGPPDGHGGWPGIGQWGGGRRCHPGGGMRPRKRHAVKCAPVQKAPIHGFGDEPKPQLSTQKRRCAYSAQHPNVCLLGNMKIEAS